MSGRKVWSLRGYRPSQFSVPDEEEQQAHAEIVRLANVKLYAKRARKGLPLFRETDHLPPVINRTQPPPQEA